MKLFEWLVDTFGPHRPQERQADTNQPTPAERTEAAIVSAQEATRRTHEARASIREVGGRVDEMRNSFKRAGTRLAR